MKFIKKIFIKEEIRTHNYSNSTYTVKVPNMPGIIGFCSAILIVFSIITSCIGTVPTGHTGVVTTFGKVENYTLDAGVHLKAPWQKIVKMDNRVQKENVALSCFSSDIQEVSMSYTVNYQISKSDAMTIYSTIGRNFYNTVIAPNVTEAVKTAVAKYSAENLVGKRNELSEVIEADLAQRLMAYNIELVAASVEDMDFSDTFTNAVEAKQVAEQNKLKAETEAKQRVIEAEAAATIKKVETEAQAEAKKITADAAAYEIQVKAEAEAEANRKLAESITESLIDYKYAETWDGSLPTYMGGEGTIPVLNFD